MDMRPYQVMFGGRMPYMTEENWLTVAERKEAKLQNENCQEDDEDSINLQARSEYEIDEPVQSSLLPGNRLLATNLTHTFVPTSFYLDMTYAEQFLSPSQDMGPPPPPPQPEQR